MKKLNQFISYFRQDYWDANSKKKPKSFSEKILRILIASIRGFFDDNCFDKASTLTFYSLLSIIPLMAIGFGIAQELGFSAAFTDQVKSQFQGQPQIAEKIIEFSDSTLKTTKGGVVAAFGLAILLWTVFRMIATIATAFDGIWKVGNAPSFWQQVKRFVPMIFLFPIFLVGSSSVILLISTKALLAFNSIEILNVFTPSVKHLFHYIPYLVSWGLLSFIYIYLPNTHVTWKAGIWAGIIAGILFVIWQWIYITFQVNASSYGAIYGGFAAVPLFLIWLNYSWLIILFGTELACHIQKIDHLYDEK